MLKINQFYWNLYKSSIKGQETIAQFQNLANGSSDVIEMVGMLRQYNSEFFLNSTEAEAIKNFNYVGRFLAPIISNLQGIDIAQLKERVKSLFSHNEEFGMSQIVPVSFYLYQLCPDFFVPYMFFVRYQYFQQIIDNFDLELDETPGPNNKEKRCLYYLDICEALYNYRIFNQLTASELCAVMYGMERGSFDADYSQQSTAYPRVWWIVGAKSQKESVSESMFWQGNPDMKKGDIVVFYEKSETFEKTHRSSITGIWTVQMDGNVDPFFYYYRYTFIGNQIKVNPIPFSVLKNDSLTANIHGISANLQNYSGREISGKDYEQILKLIAKRNPSFNPEVLPTRYKEERYEGIPFEARGDMKPEEWVEEFRIKPLLKKLGWGREDVDYRQQVFLQLGRKKSEERKEQSGRPDFSIFPFGERRKCADIVIEAKGPGEMDGGKKLKEAFDQGESYASRQYAELLGLADDKQLLLYVRSKEGYFRFTNTPYQQYELKQLLEEEESEELTKLYNTFLKFQKHKPRK